MLFKFVNVGPRSWGGCYNLANYFVRPADFVGY